MKKLFLLTGKARNGKDTVADMIEGYYKNKKVVKLSYGAFPKNYVKLLTDWDGSDNSKPRDFLTEVSMRAREINPNYMVRRMQEDINVLKNYVDVIIITDARMLQEVEMPKNFKETVTVRVERPNFDSPLTDNQQKHVLETTLDDYDDYDYVIINDGTLEQLRVKVEAILK